MFLTVTGERVVQGPSPQASRIGRWTGDIGCLSLKSSALIGARVDLQLLDPGRAAGVRNVLWMLTCKATPVDLGLARLGR